VTQASDMLLCQMVGLANKLDMRADITLSVQGTIISGQLVGMRRYLELMAEAAERGKGSASPTVAMAFREAAGRMPKGLPDSEATSPEPLYIHLEDAKILSPDASWIPQGHGMLWRGLLDRVDGFALGRLGPTALIQE
jgi:hypothetical protein